jgi:hypothetical protein
VSARIQLVSGRRRGASIKLSEASSLRAVDKSWDTSETDEQSAVAV